jgi:Protein kinase domain/Bacterial Ig-like domain (group 2)
LSHSAPPPAALPGFAPGSRVAGYRLEEQIGRGGMAVVFRAYDERLNRQVALKILAPLLAADVAFRQRFIAESQAAAAVDDPNIIPVYEAGEAGGVLFIAMRLVRGGDLKTMIAQHGPMSAGRAEWILSAVASALDAAHATGLVHRDVKPANMLLEARPGRPDHVYLSDFGVSKAALATSGLTGSGQFLGTVDYAAPEQIQDRSVDGRTDQYALGCSAFELLCGQPPFFGKQWMAGMYAHVSLDPPPPSSLRPDLPAAVDEVFARVLAKSPDNRYATCQEFAAALAEALGVRPYPAEETATARSVPAVAMETDDDATLAPAAASAHAGTSETNGSSRPGVIGLLKEPGGTELAGPDGTDPRETMSVTFGGHPAGRTRALRPRLLAAGAAALLVCVAIGAVLLASRSPGPAVFQFAQQDFPDGLTLRQAWTLTGPDGSVLDVTMTATNTTGAPVTAQLEEPVPSAVAADPDRLAFRPAAKLLTASRVAVWDLYLPARRSVVVRYEAREPPDGATQARLLQLAGAFAAVSGQEVLEPITPGGVLQSVTITPGRLRLSAGSRARLMLLGSLSNGRRAGPDMLAGAVWTVADPAVAAVNSRGLVVAESAGVTQVTVRVGHISDSVTVTVVGLGVPVPGYSYSPPPSGPSSSPAPSASLTPSPSPTPSATPSGTPNPTPSSTPSVSPTVTPTQAAGT